MTTVTVSVDATWRLSRFEFSMPHSPTGIVYGYSEFLLQESAAGGSEALRVRSSPPMPAPREGEPVTYGTMPSDYITRQISAVMEETVDVNGVAFAFSDVLAACEAFFTKWRTEDQAAPPTTLAAPPVPPPPAE